MADTGNGRGPRFDPTINLGHIITLATVIVTLIGTAWVGDFRLSAVEKEVAKLSSIVIEEAKLGVQMSEYGRRLDRIEQRLEQGR